MTCLILGFTNSTTDIRTTVVFPGPLKSPVNVNVVVRAGTPARETYPRKKRNQARCAGQTSRHMERNLDLRVRRRRLSQARGPSPERLTMPLYTLTTNAKSARDHDRLQNRSKKPASRETRAERESACRLVGTQPTFDSNAISVLSSLCCSFRGFTTTPTTARSTHA